MVNLLVRVKPVWYCMRMQTIFDAQLEHHDELGKTLSLYGVAPTQWLAMQRAYEAPGAGIAHRPHRLSVFMIDLYGGVVLDVRYCGYEPTPGELCLPATFDRFESQFGELKVLDVPPEGVSSRALSLLLRTDKPLHHFGSFTKSGTGALTRKS